jgi:hypothetical protein
MDEEQADPLHLDQHDAHDEQQDHNEQANSSDRHDQNKEQPEQVDLKEIPKVRILFNSNYEYLSKSVLKHCLLVILAK